MPDSRLETGATNIRLLWPALQSQVSELNNFLHKKRISPFRPRAVRPWGRNRSWQVQLQCCVPKKNGTGKPVPFVKIKKLLLVAKSCRRSQCCEIRVAISTVKSIGRDGL